MKIEVTLAQLMKLSRLSPESWKPLLNLIKEGGSGDFAPDLQEAKDLGLIQKVGPVAYVKFLIDGALPTKLPQVAKRNKSNELPAFMSVWRSHSKGYLTGADLAALKRFVANYSLDEFKELLRGYLSRISVNDASLKELWSRRNRFSTKSLDDTFGGGDDDEHSF